MDGTDVDNLANVGMTMEHTMSGLMPETMVEGLANDVAHEVQVAAENAVGMGPYSESAKATPMAMDPTETPALPFFGAVALGAGLAGRAHMRRRQLLRGRGRRKLGQITGRSPASPRAVSFGLYHGRRPSLLRVGRRPLRLF